MSDRMSPVECAIWEALESRLEDVIGLDLNDVDDSKTFRELVKQVASAVTGVVTEEPEAAWQWCYVEKWADGSGVYERVTFDREAKAWKYLRDNVERVEGLNQEFPADDRIVASVERRCVFTPGDWVPVKQGDETGASRGYGPEYDAAWEAMTAKPAYSWGMAPIHHGVFENAWRSALEAAAQIVERGGTVGDIRELAVYDETPAVKQEGTDQ